MRKIAATLALVADDPVHRLRRSVIFIPQASTMARNDWVALVTDPAAEYVARTELERFGLRPYLPQLRKRWVSPHVRAVLPRKYPLFPRYLLLPLRDADALAVRICRGVRRAKPILCNAEGRPWRAPDLVIRAVMTAEVRGDFDEFLVQGDKVVLAKGVLAGVKAVLTGLPVCNRVEVLLPLFGGARTSVPEANVARA
jgi:hypothetical protein